MEFGLIPEFIGRLPVDRPARHARPRGARAHPRRAQERARAPVHEDVRDERQGTGRSPRTASGAIADLAIERETGVRALRAILEDILLDLLYELPSRKDTDPLRRGRGRRQRRARAVPRPDRRGPRRTRATPPTETRTIESQLRGPSARRLSGSARECVDGNFRRICRFVVASAALPSHRTMGTRPRHSMKKLRLSSCDVARERAAPSPAPRAAARAPGASPEDTPSADSSRDRPVPDRGSENYRRIVGSSWPSWRRPAARPRCFASCRPKRTSSGHFAGPKRWTRQRRDAGAGAGPGRDGPQDSNAARGDACRSVPPRRAARDPGEVA